MARAIEAAEADEAGAPATLTSTFAPAIGVLVAESIT
jgi:hypothetical protein